MFDFKKKGLLILLVMLVLISIPISFASDIDANGTEIGVVDSSSEILTSDDGDHIEVENTNYVIDVGEDVEIKGTVILEVSGSDYYDELNLQYDYVDSNGESHSNQVHYLQDYSSDGFSFTIKNFNYTGSPYIIKISAVEDELYDDYLVYGDPLDPVYVTVEVVSPFDPEPGVPNYETFTPAGQLYVSAEDGNDSFDGSQDAPFATIQKALDQNKALGGNYEVVVLSGNYTFDTYYTISNNVSISGRGKVKITNDGSRYIFFLSGPNTVEFKNLIITDGQYGAISSSATQNGLGEYVNEGKVLNIVNCTFEENYGDFGVIKTYSKTTILNSTFRNNYAVGYQKEFSGLINLPDGSLTINYCNFIDNEVKDNTPLIYTAYRSDANFNFWGTNDGPEPGDLSENVKVRTWAVIVPEIEETTVLQKENYTVNVFYKYTNSTKIFKTLDYAMPKLLVDLKTQRGNVTPSKVELTNNFANTTYSSNQRGNEKVSVYLGETELSYITFTVEATLGDRIYVSTYGNDSNLGDFEEPLKTLEAAIAKNKLAGGDKTIYILNGTYEENDLEINDSVSIIGNESIISAKKLTISNNTNITNVKFINFDIILHDAGNLMIAQSIFENNRVGICSTSEETASITNSTFIDNIVGVLGKNMIVDNVDFINNLQILVASSSNVTNSRFINNKVEFGADVLINDNNFSSTEVIALNANSTKIADNNFLNSTINATNSSITVYNNVFTDYDGYALDINSSNIDLKNNTISGLKSINIFNSTITNAIIIFMENSTYKFENGTIEVNATVTDDMGNPINGGKLSFDAIGETEIIDGFAAISDNFTTKGDYVISGGSDNFPDATILEGLIRINVENFWFIGDVGYETLADAIDAAETDDVIKGIPGEYEYDEINIGHRTRPSEPWVINKQITITSLTDEPITLKALGENIFDIDYYSNVTVINMIFMNAYHPDGWGGAIHSMGKNKIVVDNCTFMNNYAYDGGAIHAWGDLYVKDSLFIDNGARAYAGALFKDGDGNFVIENCKFINNTAETYAGAVYTMGYSDTYQIFTNITFDGNEATCAGALFTMGKNVTFTDCNFTNNRAIDKNSGYDPLGGAVYVHNGATKFVNVRFVNNTAEGNGGALELDNGASSVVNSSGRHVDIYWAILENCLIENNTATGFGGAIYSNEIKTHVNITDSVIRNNEAYNAVLFVNIYGFYVLDNVLVENNKNNGGDLLIYTYGAYSFPEPFYANTTIKNSILKNNSADIVLCAVSEYVVINVTDTQFDASGQILESELSRAYLTNLIETNSIANYTVNNTGTLSLSNNTFENPIYTTGVVDTPTYVVIIGNETIFVDVGDVVIDAVVLDDNNNSIVGGNLVFFVNNELISAVLEKTVYKANYTVVPSNQTINAVYDDIGLLNITNKYGIIMGRVMPNITAEDVEFNISGEFKVELSYNNTPISDADLVVKIDGKEYSVKTDSNGTATLNLELGAGKHVADIIFNGTELYSATAGQANITVYKFVSEISVKVEDIYLHEDAIVNITLPDDATGDIIVTVGGKDYNAKASNGNVLIAIPNLGEGEYSAIVDYYGDERYLNAFARTTFKVKSDKQEENDNKTSKTAMVFNFSVPDGISGNVTVLVDGKEVAVVYVTDGKGSVVLTDLDEGNHTFDVKYDMNLPENNATVPTNNTAVVKKDTVIVVDPAFTRVANDYYVGERGAFFYAVLKDSEGNVLVNKTVSIAVNGPIYNVTTDEDGRAGLQVNFMNANIYTYALAFAGDDEYNAAQLASSKLTITKKSTSITAAAKSYKVKATKKYTVTLKTVKNPYNGKTYLKSGKKLTLKVKGKTYTAKINTKGKATFTLKLTKKGKFTAKIKFAGDKTYKASSKSVKITIK